MPDANLPLTHVHVEPREPTEGPAPAVFVLHGRGADEQDLLQVARELPDDLHVVSFRAPDRLMGGWTWYELDMPDGDLHRSQPHADDFRRSLDLVSESVDAAVEAYDLDPDRLGLLGFSQGAITSLSTLFERPADFRWVVALHGYLADSHAGQSPEGIAETPVFVGAGTGDQIIPVPRAEAAAERLHELGADVTFETYQTGHGIAPPELRDVVAFVEANY